MFEMLDSNTLASAAAGAGFGALAKAFDGPFKSLEDLWYRQFGYKTALARAEREAQVETYKKDILEELNKISPQNYQKPKLNIIGPALEASKYYIEESELRKMFAKLIASATDSTRALYVHPAFVQVIKQMTADDAVLLSQLPDFGPLANINLTLRNKKASEIIADYIYLSNEFPQYSSKISLSMANFERLNIINVSHIVALPEKDAYSLYEVCDKYKEAMQILKNNPNQYERCYIERFYFTTTVFGRTFKNICLANLLLK